MTGALWPSLLPPSAHGRDDLCLVSAEGTRVRDASGRSLLCATSGLWNVNLGYGNRVIADAVHDAMVQASYLGVFRWENQHARVAAQRLVEFAGRDRYSHVQFATSGGAANDLVMKVARQFHALRGDTGRRVIVGLKGGYHGLTFGSFALTSDELGQRMYGVDRSAIVHVDVNDVEQLRRLFERNGSKIAAVVVEPLQGTGAVELSDDYVGALGELRDAHGTLLVADEVATGFGRTGWNFASQAWTHAPDVLVTSKGLTNGTMPASAVLVSERVAEPFVAADTFVAHAETQAGTAVSAAAVIATIDQMEALDAVGSARRLASGLDARLARLEAEQPDVDGVRGSGCFRAVGVSSAGEPLTSQQVGELVACVRHAGLVVHPGPSGFQLIPSLVTTESELDEMFDLLGDGLERFRRQSVRGAA